MLRRAEGEVRDAAEGSGVGRHCFLSFSLQLLADKKIVLQRIKGRTSNASIFDSSFNFLKAKGHLYFEKTLSFK